MRSTVAGLAPGTTSGTVVLTWPDPTLDASTATITVTAQRCAALLNNVMLPRAIARSCALRPPTPDPRTRTRTPNPEPEPRTRTRTPNPEPGTRNQVLT